MRATLRGVAARRDRAARHFLRGCVAAALLALLVVPGIGRAAPDWSGEILYFVLIDRFADGDTGNNQRVERRNPGRR